MSKISIYEVVPVPKLADKLVGTSVGGDPEDITYNFTLSELLNLFIPNIPGNTLQGVLDFGNTATQNINLTGIITTTTLNVGSTANILNSNLTGQTKITGGLYDRLNSIGTAGQVLTSTGTQVEWYTIPTVIPDLQQVLTSGNTAVNNIILTGNLSANNAALLTSTISTSLTLLGTLRDGLSSVGANNQVLSSNVTGVRWVNLPVYSATSPLLYNSGTGVFSIQQANASQNGYLSSADWITFDGKQTSISLTTTGNSGASTLVGATINVPNYTLSGLGGVPLTRTLTINGVTYNLAADRSWTLATGVSSVTATTPLSSTGGVNPDISIQQSSSSLDGYLSSTDWLTFNSKQPAGNYITSLTGEATAAGPGAASVTLSNAAVIGKLLTGLSITGSAISSSDSILTAFGKVQNQINGLIGGVQFQGVWNAATNTPALVSSVGTQGYYYIVSVAGNTNLNGITDWQVGDWAIFNGSTWNKVDNTDLVTSVNGQVGAVSLTTDNIPEGATNLYYLDSRARAALSFAAGSGAYNSTTGVITIPTDNSQILNGAGYITLVSLSATSPLTYNNTTGAFSIQVANTTQDGYLSSTDWNTFNGKQPFLGGTGLVKSVAGVISYITDNSANWNTAYNDSIVSAAVTGTATKTLTLNQQDGGTITASWSDIDTGLTSVGVSMPSAFTVTNSPLTSNGTIAITGSGNTLQYVDGTGALQSFPSLTGYVPYTGATANVNLGIYNLTAASLIKNGGTSGQFLKADGSVDSSAYIVLGSLSATAPLSYNNTTGVFTISQSGASTNGYLSSTDWNTFNSKEPAITAGTTLQYYRGDKTFQTLNTTVVPEGTNLYYLDSRARTAISLTTTGSSGAATYNNTTGVFNIPDYGSALSGYVPTSRQLSINGTQYDLSADRSWSVGTVTSVAALTLGTTGTDLSSSVATGTTTPVITLNVPTASAANRGALSAADWSTFNTKVGGVTATSPLFSSGGQTPNITIQQSSGSQAGYLSSTDWTTFNNKQAAGNYITSLTGEATATGPGAAAVTLDNAAVTGKILTGVNITGGTILSTDSILTGFGKLQNQVNGLIGGSIYQGTWNANTNTPTLTSSVGTAGYYYIVSVAGNTNLNGITDWQVGDWAIFNGGVWQKVDNTDSVISVNGQTGAVSLTTDNISEGVTNLYFTNTRARAALSFVAGSGAYNSSTGAITIPTNTSQLTNGANFITLASLSGTAPISYNSGTGAISITQSGTASNGYLSSTDWNTFNNKQATIILTTTGTSGAATLVGATLNVPNYGSALTGYVPYTGATANVDLGIYGLITNYNWINGDNSTNGGYVGFKQFSSSASGPLGYTSIYALNQNLFGINYTQLSGAIKGIVFNSGSITSGNVRTYTFPDSDGTIALVGGSGVGTVTSVAALTIGTTGTDLSSTVANSTTTPVITLNVPTASATNRGALSAADWTTFNNKQSALTNPVLASGSWTSGYVPKINGSYTITNSVIFDDGSGNVGINITTPTAQLHLNSGGSYTNTDANNRIIVERNSNTYLMFVSPNEFDQGIHFAKTTGIVGRIAYFQRAAGDSMNFSVASSIRMTLFSSGNLYVGTSATDVGYRLEVDGVGRFNDSLTVKNYLYVQPNVASGLQGLYLQNNNTGGYGVTLGLGLYGYATGAYFSTLRIESSYPGYGRTLFYTKAQSNSTEVLALNLDGTGSAAFGSTLSATTLTANTGLITSDGTNAFVDINGSTSGTLAGVRLYSSGSTKWIISHSTPSTYNFSIGTATSLTTFTERFGINYSTGVATINNLAGTGSRIVVADASGNLSASSALSGYVTGSGLTNYVTKWTSSSNVGYGIIYDNGTTAMIGTTTASSFNDKFKVVGGVGSNGLVRFENSVNQSDLNHGTLHIVNTAAYAIGNDASIAFSLNRADDSYQDPRASIGAKTESSYGGALVFNTRSDQATYSEKVRITGIGNVGIATATPFSLLHVGTRPGAGTTNPSLGSILTVSNDGLTGIDLGGNVNANNVVGHINWVNYLGVGNYNTARIDVYADGAGNSGSLRFWTASVSSSPTIRLTIASTGAATFSASVTAASYLGVLKDGSDTIGAGAYLVLAATTSSRQWIQQLSASQNLTYYHYNGSAWIQPVTFTSGGNVLIGTITDAGYKLDVNGTGRFSGNLTVQNATSGRYFNFVTDSSASYLDVSHSLNVRVNGASSLLTALTISSTGAATFSSSVGVGGFGAGYSNLESMRSTFGSTVPLISFGIADGTYNPRSTISYKTQTGSAYTVIFDSGYSSGWAATNYAFASGNVGIGTTTPTSLLHTYTTVAADNAGHIQYENGNTGTGSAANAQLIGKSKYGTVQLMVWEASGIRFGMRSTANGGAGNIYFTTGTDSVKMLLTSGGNLLIGTTSDNGYTLQNAGNTTFAGQFVQGGGSGRSTNGTTVALTYNTAFSANSDTGDGGRFLSIVNESTVLNAYSALSFRVNPSSGGSSGNVMLDMKFVNNGSVTSTLYWTFLSGGAFYDRMALTSGGALCIGTSTPYGSNLLNVNGGIYATSSIAAVVAADIDMFVFQNTGASYTKSCFVASMTATGGTGSYFFYGQQSTSTVALKIFSNGNIQNTNNSYGAISDARLKENIKDATPKLDDLMKVKVRNYNLKGESNKQLGVISQELEAIFPNMIEESTNIGESMKIKGVKYSVFVPMLIKAIQEQQEQINYLKSKIQ